MIYKTLEFKLNSDKTLVSMVISKEEYYSNILEKIYETNDKCKKTCNKLKDKKENCTKKCDKELPENPSIRIPKIKFIGLKTLTDRRVRIYKFDSDTIIKKFIYSTSEEAKKITVIPSDFHPLALPRLLPDPQPYEFYADGSIQKRRHFQMPPRIEFTKFILLEYKFSHYISMSKTALVNNQVHIFGGSNDARKVIYNLNSKKNF